MKFAPIPFDSMKRHTAGAVRQGVSDDTLLARSLIGLRYGDHRDLISPAQCLLLCMNTVLAVEDATVNAVGGAVTVGLAHYSTTAEVDQLVRALASLG